MAAFNIVVGVNFSRGKGEGGGSEFSLRIWMRLVILRVS